MRVALFAAFVLAAAVLFLVAPSIDLRVSGLFWRAGEGFFWRDWPPFRVAHDRLPWLTGAIAVFLLAGVVWWAVRRRPWFGLEKKALAFLLLALVLGPGVLVNMVFKDNWGRARPVQVQEFGGAAKFTPPLVRAKECRRNCSFVAGDPSIGFWFLAPAFLAQGLRRRLAIAGALSLGAFLGLTRIAQGGHFLSDVVFCGFVVAGLVWLLHRTIIVGDVFSRLRGSSHDGP